MLVLSASGGNVNAYSATTIAPRSYYVYCSWEFIGKNMLFRIPLRVQFMCVCIMSMRFAVSARVAEML
jgi:hypothetical protein